MKELVLIKTPKPEEIIERIKSRASLRDDSIEATITISIPEGEMKQETATQSESDKNASMLSRAKIVLRHNKISFNPQMHNFNVKGTQGVVQVVTLHPKETCSCAASGTCYHIMAAQFSYGIKDIPKSKERNFSTLYKTAKDKSKQKSCQKWPLTKDENLSTAQYSSKFQIETVLPEDTQCTDEGN